MGGKGRGRSFLDWKRRTASETEIGVRNLELRVRNGKLT